MKIHEPLYQLTIEATALEEALMQTTVLRRLKFIHHYGITALHSPVTHSRFEHTLGVWALTAHYFPEDELLRIAALLHDIGHFPFSHTFEASFRIDHHTQTEKRIRADETAGLLQMHGFTPDQVIHKLNQDSPLTSKGSALGIDHLESFIRDTYQLGKFDILPAKLLPNLTIIGNGFAVSNEIAQQLVQCIAEDQRFFLQPKFLAFDGLMAEAVKEFMQAEAITEQEIADLTDYQLLAALESSSSETVQQLIQRIVWNPELISEVQSEEAEVSYSIRKLYHRLPMLWKEDEQLEEQLKQQLASIEPLQRWYHFRLGLTAEGSLSEE